MNKLSEEQKQIVVKTYDACLKNLINHTFDHGKTFVKLLETHEFGRDIAAHDFSESTKEAFLSNLKDFYDYHHNVESLAKDAKAIIKGEEIN